MISIAETTTASISASTCVEYERIKENAAVIEACQGGSASGERKDAEVTLFMEKAE